MDYQLVKLSVILNNLNRTYHLIEFFLAFSLTRFGTGPHTQQNYGTHFCVCVSCSAFNVHLFRFKIYRYRLNLNSLPQPLQTNHLTTLLTFRPDRSFDNCRPTTYHSADLPPRQTTDYLTILMIAL